MRFPIYGAAVAVALLAGPAFSAEFGTPDEARAMLDKALAAVTADKAAALAGFTAGTAPFKDRDLYVFCGGADGVFTAHGANASLVGKSLRDLKDKAGAALGAEIYAAADKGGVQEVAYSWPRPGATDPSAKVAFVSKAADQVCAVGYYK